MTTYMTQQQYDALQQISLDTDKLIDLLRAEMVKIEKIAEQISEDDPRSDYLTDALPAFERGIGSLEAATRNLDDIDVPE